MRDPEDRFPTSTVTIAMLISEAVYKLVVIVERLIWWFNKAVPVSYTHLRAHET